MKSRVTLANSLMLVMLLGASESLAGALLILAMSVVVISLYGACMIAPRTHLNPTGQLLASVLLAATLCSCADILLQSGSVQWHAMVGLYAGLIGLQCVVLEHNGFFHQPVRERVAVFARFAATMMLLAASRELIGQGSIGRHLSEHWQGLVLFGEDLSLVRLVPGGLILLGILIAARQSLPRSHAPSEETHHP